MSTDDINVLYDVLCDTATALTGRYIELGRAAKTPEEEEYWSSRIMALRNERRSVDHNDREAIREHTRRWVRELEELER
ncbi:hypothetical protein NI17_024195 (plasmid) [Thermobifida halotolerans]|uniref:Uncharacterized protein n=1 Tax=Thermobifida halotolerans TaxID=483545 RepID=A0A399FW76_9ACTN|nr:hypothetical protein [Thermobifida halotolerans]UOE21500.1 hypothetical protein NI17_010565 [Thermobifida halotolerans]UOE22268.1 hypothetical protein NI17_024195 [Thermobifida halotolerans]